MKAVGTRHTSGTDGIRSKSQLCKDLCIEDSDNDETSYQDGMDNELEDAHYKKRVYERRDNQ